MSDHVDVIGNGSASATPDLVVLDVRVQVEAQDVAAALRGLATRTDTAMQAAADHGVVAANRRTTGLGVSPRWDREGQRVVGHTAFQSVRLRVAERDQVGAVVDALAGAAGDALGIDTISFDLADRGPLEERARAEAFADARARAEQYAVLAGRSLGPVQRVVEEPPGGGVGPSPKTRTAGLDVSAGVPVDAGESTVTVQVQVRFGLGAP